jgi:hypothetical protein
MTAGINVHGGIYINILIMRITVKNKKQSGLYIIGKAGGNNIRLKGAGKYSACVYIRGE